MIDSKAKTKTNRNFQRLKITEIDIYSVLQTSCLKSVWVTNQSQGVSRPHALQSHGNTLYSLLLPTWADSGHALACAPQTAILSFHNQHCLLPTLSSYKKTDCIWDLTGSLILHILSENFNLDCVAIQDISNIQYICLPYLQYRACIYITF